MSYSMAILANHLSFLFFLILILSSSQIHARDNKFFNKIPTNNNGHEKMTKEVTPNKEQEPNFLPENENGYGVYDHESGQLSPSTTTPMNYLPNSKYLPKNYNPVAYVTVPQDNPNDNNDDNNNNNNNYNQYYNSDSTYGNVNDNNYNNYNQYYSGDNTYDNNNNNNQYYSGDSTYNDNQYHNGGSYYYNNNNYPYKNVGNNYFNNQEQINPTKYNHYNGGNGHRVQQQGMSDTRFLKYENEEEFQVEEGMP